MNSPGDSEVYDRTGPYAEIDKLIAERDALRAEVKRHGVAFDALSDAFNSQQAQLTELREAVQRYAIEGWGNWHNRDALAEVLAKVSR